MLGPLVSVRDILAGHGDGSCPRAASSRDVLLTIARYVSDFLTKAHPELGRPGAVCPFAAGGLQRDAITVTASTLDRPDKAALLEAISGLAAQFDAVGAGSSASYELYRAVIVAFPRLPVADAVVLIEEVQRELKPDFVARGLMIGEFFPGCPAPGLHNDAFRPLDTPFCSLAIRRMTVSDAPFMVDDDRFAAAYLSRFAAEGQRRLECVRAQMAAIRQRVASVGDAVLGGVVPSEA